MEPVAASPLDGGRGGIRGVADRAHPSAFPSHFPIRRHQRRQMPRLRGRVRLPVVLAPVRQDAEQVEVVAAVAGQGGGGGTALEVAEEGVEAFGEPEDRLEMLPYGFG